MKIDKISFEQMAQNKGIDKAFEDFDVNNDGIINEQDAALAAQITNLLNSVDEEAKLSADGDFDFDNNSERTTNSLDNSSKTQEIEKAGYIKEKAVTDTDSAEKLPAMIDEANNPPMIDNSPNAIKIRNSVEKLSHKPFAKLSEKDIEKHKNNPSTIKNPDGTYTAKTNLNGSGCITFDEEGNILYKTFTYNLDYSKRSSSNLYASTITYDGCGRLLAKTFHDGKTVTYEYNDDGTYTKTVMNTIKDKTTTYRYKNDGELISKESQNGVDEQKKKKAHAHTHSDGSYTIPNTHYKYEQRTGDKTSYTGKMTLYDCNGKPISQIESKPAGVLNWQKGQTLKCEEFDDEGRPLRYTSTNGSILEYEYNDEDGKVSGTLTRKDGYVYHNYTRSSIKNFLKSHGT